MNPNKKTLKCEFETAFEYYKKTVWKHVRNLPLAGAQYAVALRAWERLDTACRAWLESLDWSQKAAVPEIRAFKPCRLERDDTVKPELLATVASARLGTPKPKSIRDAAEEAHRIIIASRDYLKSLPEPKEKSALMVEAYSSSVSFEDILDSSGKPDCVPLLPPVQAKRNDGNLKLRALEQALKRYAAGAPKKIQHGIRDALKNKVILCRLLEEIRWERFRQHFKG
jgi:hypothetical protein